MDYRKDVNEELPFKALVTEALCKSATVHSICYTKEEDYETHEAVFDTSNVPWKFLYKQEHLTISQLLIEFSLLIKIKLTDKNISPSLKKHLLYLEEECKDWRDCELEVIEN